MDLINKHIFCQNSKNDTELAKKRKSIFYVSIKISFALLLIIAIFTSWLITLKQKRSEVVTIYINKAVIKSESISRLTDLYKGLSNRKYLEKNSGMLFNFEGSELRDFVMRDMNFPLDIIFINNDSIVNIAKNLAPEGSNPQNIYNSMLPANRVLEVNAGYCDNNNIKIGDKVLIKYYD